MKYSKIFQISAKNESDTKRIHYVNADNEAQAVADGKEVWPYIEVAHDVTDSHFSEEEKKDLPEYVWVS